MPDKDAPVFALGDLVAVHQGSGSSTYEVWGRITKVTAKGSITVTMQLKLDLQKIEVEAFDVAIGELAELRTWFARKPKP